MPAPYGVTSTGFNAKSLAEIRADLVVGMQGIFGPAVNTDPRSRLGQLIDTFAEQLSEVWLMGEALSDALNPTTASGLLLDYLSNLTGVKRLAAKATRVTLQLLGTVGTVVGAGKQVGQPGTSYVFSTVGSATIATVPEYNTQSNGATVAAGALYKNSATSTPAIWRARNTGVLGNPITTPAGENATHTDGSVVWDRVSLNVSLGCVNSDADCTITGPVVAPAQSCTVINTPVAGWSAVVNVTDGTTGNDLELDPPMRGRRADQLSAAASTPLDGLRAAILALPGVTSCTLFENVGDVAVGVLPAHSFEALVEGGVDAVIRSTIWANKPGGILANGNNNGSVTDSNGVSHSVSFSRPTPVAIYANLTVTKDPATYPSDGDAQVVAAVQAAIAALPVGADVYATRIAAAAFAVKGVLSATATVGTTPAPVGSSVSIDTRSRATNTGGLVGVATVNGSP